MTIIQVCIRIGTDVCDDSSECKWEPKTNGPQNWMTIATIIKCSDMTLGRKLQTYLMAAAYKANLLLEHT